MMELIVAFLNFVNVPKKALGHMEHFTLYKA